MTNPDAPTMTELPLQAAAMRLGFSREKTIRWLMSGKLTGRYDDSAPSFAGRWFVSVASIEDVEKKSSAAPDATAERVA